MPKKRRPKKRRSTSTRSSKRAKPRAKPKDVRRSKRAPTPVKRKSASRRSAAAKKGWAKRRKKQRLIAAMADVRLRRSDQPIGWIERRTFMRSISGGKIWRQIAYDYDASARDRERLAELERLQIDFLTRDELYDYLSWMADELEIDISDMYRMYLGYEVGEAAE